MKRKIVISILFVILLASCTAAKTVIPTQDIELENLEIIPTVTYLAEDIDIADGGLLSGLPCASPCAFGINIGETQLDQAISVLENNGISRCWTEPNLSWSLISCGGNRFNVQVDMQTNLVNAVWFDPSVPISLGEIIEKYGEPNYVTVDQETPGTIHPRLYWNSIRMLVTLPEISTEGYGIEKTTEVEGISFSDENLYRTAEKESDPYYKPWNGYGIYQPPAETIPLTPLPTVMMTPTPLPYPTPSPFPLTETPFFSVLVDRHDPESVIRAYFDAWKRSDSTAMASVLFRSNRQFIFEPMDSLEILEIQLVSDPAATERVYTVLYNVQWTAKEGNSQMLWNFYLSWDANRDSWLITNYGFG